MTNWEDFYDRNELAEQREQFGVEHDDYDDYDDRNYADNYDSEGRYFGKDELIANGVCGIGTEDDDDRPPTYAEDPGFYEVNSKGSKP